MKAERKYSGLEIAIIGMAGRFPGASNINEFWNNLKNGVDAISFLSVEDLKKYKIDSSLLNNPKFVPTLGGVLQGKDIFDASFFNYSPREAETMDPQFRLLHECSWHALEDAGYDAGSYDGEIGIYAGASSNFEWSIFALLSGRTELLGSLTSLTLLEKDFLPNRVSYCLNLKGPAVGVQTACSTSLTAVHIASRALLTGECDMALAGGVKLTTFPTKGYVYQEGMLSPIDGHCRSFDAKATGSTGGDGIGVVVLKRLKRAINDKDNIYAVILGSAVNNDGKLKVGFVAPSVEARVYVIKKALHIAQVEHESITYIETQGIGTLHGDSIEIEALKQAFNTDKKGFCGIGSVKTNIGHLDVAAGIAGLIKTVLALKHQLIPPSLNFDTPNPHIDFVNSPFYVNTKLHKWENDKYPLRAGVNCFGIGGTNVQVLLEEAPALKETERSRKNYLVLLSAKTKLSLDKTIENLSRYLQENPGIEIADAAYTLQVGRKAFPYRGVLVAQDVKETVHGLTSPNSTTLHTAFTQQENRPIVLMFPGEGWQYAGMGLDIYRREPVFREAMDHCFEILNTLTGSDVKKILYPTDVGDWDGLLPGIAPEFASPLLFAFEYALAKLLMEWGIKPYAAVGESSGEYVAATLAGVFAPEDALKLAVFRGKQIQRKLTPLELENFEKVLRQTELKKTTLSYISNVTDHWITGRDTINTDYWFRHLHQTDRFAPGLEKLLMEEGAVFVEIGPGESLGSFIKQHKNKKENQLVLTLVPHPGQDISAHYYLLDKIGQLWLYGESVEWKALYPGESVRRISLPGYPFERQRYWIDENFKNIDPQVFFMQSLLQKKKNKPGDTGEPGFFLSRPRPNLSTSFVPPRNLVEQVIANLWQQYFGIEQVGTQDSFLELGGDSLKATRVTAMIHKELGVNIPLLEFFRRPTIKELAEYIESAEKTSYYSIEPSEKKEYYLLAPAQKRMYVLNQMDTDSIAYNISHVMMLTGKLDKEKLARTFKMLVMRHESLRTSFHMLGDLPVQSICENPPFEVHHDDISKTDTEGLIEGFIQPFDLERAPLLRIGIIKESEEKHIMIADIHHIIFDGTSLDILIKEFTELYTGKELPLLEFQYKDFSEWQNSPRQKGMLSLQKTYWLGEFSGKIPVIKMPVDYSKSLSRNFTGSNTGFILSAEQTGALNHLAIHSGSTLYMMLLGIYYVLLSKLSGQEDIVIGTPTAGRRHADLEEIIGMFVNTLALRNYPAGEKTYGSFLNDVKEKSLAAFENQDYPYEELVESVAVRRDLSRNPLFDTFFNLQNTGTWELEIPGLRVTPYEYKVNLSKFHLTLSCTEVEDILACTFKYSTDLFNRETVERIRTYFINIVNGVIKDKNRRLSDLEIMSDSEKRQILFDFNDTREDCQSGKSIPRLFEKQVEKKPDQIAVVYKEWQLNYRELNEKANQTAELLTASGIGKETLTPVLMEHSPELLISFLALLKAGATFVPLDVHLPVERLKTVLNDLGRGVVLVNQFTPWTGNNMEPKAIMVLPDKIDGNRNNPRVPSNHEQPVCVMYDPLANGKSKGVVIPQQQLINWLYWMNAYFGTESSKSILQTSGCFHADVLWQFFWPLINGGKTVILPPGFIMRDDTLAYMIETHRITLVDFLPSIFSTLVQDIEANPRWKKKFISLKDVLMGGGEIIPTVVYKFLKIFPNLRVTNLYAPAQTTLSCVYHRVTGDEGDKIPIGSPISNVMVFIMDRYKKPVPVGPTGEIYLAGAGVGPGYLNNPGKTSSDFERNPFAPGKCLYRTGALGRWSGQGKIDFLGMIDSQVKIRGFRIQLTKIENLLLKNEKIKAAVVTPISEGHTNGDDEKSLVAYIVLKNKITMEEIRADLSKTLPDYMIPSYFIKVEKIPLTPNGRVDQKALSLEGKKLEKGEKYVPPQSKLQESIASAWKEILNLEKIGIHDNFFDIGGNSIKLIQVITRLKQSIGINIKIITIYRYTTIQALTDYLEQPQIQEKAIMGAKDKENDGLILIENYITSNFDIRAYYKNHLVGVENNNYRVLYISRGLEDKEKLFRDLKEKFKDIYPHYIKFIESEDEIIETEKIDTQSFETAMGLTNPAAVPDEIGRELNKNLHITDLLKKNNILRKYEVSPPQRAFLLDLEVIAKKNISFSYDFTYPIEFEGIKKIVIKVINENSLLRSIIVKHSDTFRIEEFDSYSNIEIPFVDLSYYLFNRQEITREILKQHLEQPFTVLGNVLYRAVAVKLNESNYKLVFEFNHLVFDGGSFLVLEEQIDEAQKEPPTNIEGKKKKIDYYDYSTFLHNLKYEKIHLENYLPITQYLETLDMIREKGETGAMKDDFFEIDLSIINTSAKDIYNEILFFSYARLIGDLYEIDNVPLILYSYGRNYKDGKFNDIIGTFQDYIPVSLYFDGDKDSNFKALLENLLDYREYIKNNNLNFVNFVIKKYQEREKYLKLLSSPFKFNPQFGKYELYKTLAMEDSSKVLWQFETGAAQVLFEVNASKDTHSDKSMIRFIQNTTFKIDRLKELFVRHFEEIAGYFNKKQ